jgi:hypothetical protein
MTKQEFWNSFEANMPALEQLINGESNVYAGYNALSADLREFNELLIPEITKEKEVYVLIISCDGIREGIPWVEELTEDIKEYPNWKIVKFRQPNAMEYIPINGIKVHRNAIWLNWEKTPDNKYNLTFFPKWHSGGGIYQKGAMLHLDHSIGEYNVMTRIEAIEFKRQGLFQSKDRLKTLDDLKIEIDVE